MNYIEFLKDGSTKDSLPLNVTEIKPKYYLLEPRETTPMYSSGWFDLLINALRKDEKVSTEDIKNNSFNARFKHLGDMLDEIVLPSAKSNNLRPYGQHTTLWNIYNGVEQGS